MNSLGISVLVEGAGTSAALLLVVLFVVVWAHVKDGEQTALPSQFDFCTLSVHISATSRSRENTGSDIGHSHAMHQNDTGNTRSGLG